MIDRHLFVIFGATGDLGRRKLIPAIYQLTVDFDLSHHAVVLGVASSARDDPEFRRMARSALVESGLDDQAVAEWCDRFLHYHRLDTGPGGYDGLAARIAAVEEEHGLPGNRVFYLALPPGLFAEAIEGLGRAGLAAGPGWTRLVVEKPFGTDLASARGLNELVHHWFGESQVYRIDHYLGKETVQNLLVFRFTNPLFERAWNRDRVRCVEITVAEDLGIGTRAGFYDDAGALRDIVQNHLAQVLTLVAMDPPVRFAADDIRNKKVEVLRAITPVAPDEVVFGQYTAGTVGGEPVAGYRDEPGVYPESTTETAVAMRLGIDSWRWEGVPFYIRTGKRFPRRLTRIVVRFQEAPVCLFHGEPDDCHAEPNILVITLQPEEGFDLLFDVKEPKEATGLRREALHFRYEDEFGPLPDAYETLLMDIIEGDQTLFVRGDETEASWRVFGPVIESRPPVHPYPAGTWGPEEAMELPRRDGFTWFDG